MAGRRRTFAFYFPNWRNVVTAHPANPSEARLSKVPVSESRLTFLIIHHLTISKTKKVGKGIQCLCFTVLQGKVGPMLGFLSFTFSFRSPPLYCSGQIR